jgi:hypothetical protein
MDAQAATPGAAPLPYLPKGGKTIRARPCFFRDRRRRLYAHIGGDPSVVQKIATEQHLSRRMGINPDAGSENRSVAPSYTRGVRTFPKSP